MPAYLSIMAIAVPHVLGGTFVVESVFLILNWRLSHESARYHDYNLADAVKRIMSGILVIFGHAQPDHK